MCLCVLICKREREKERERERESKYTCVYSIMSVYTSSFIVLQNLRHKHVSYIRAFDLVCDSPCVYEAIDFFWDIFF